CGRKSPSRVFAPGSPLDRLSCRGSSESSTMTESPSPHASAEALQRRIEELQHQLAAVQQERDIYALIVQNAPAFISRLTPDGRVLYMNRTCEQITGYSTAEATGKVLLPLLYPDELMAPVEEYLRLAAEGHDVRDHELT